MIYHNKMCKKHRRKCDILNKVCYSSIDVFHIICHFKSATWFLCKWNTRVKDAGSINTIASYRIMVSFLFPIFYLNLRLISEAQGQYLSTQLW